MLAYSFIIAISVNDVLYLCVSQHLMLDYLYENNIYLTTCSTKNRAKLIFLKIILVYRFIYQIFAKRVYTRVIYDIKCYIICMNS